MALLRSVPRPRNSYKVRLLLGPLGVDYELVDHDTKGGRTHASDLLGNFNLGGEVSVLEFDHGAKLPESGAILVYLAEGTPYLPEARLVRAQALDILRAVRPPAQPVPAAPVAHVWIEITPQKDVDLERFFEADYGVLSLMERHLAERAFFVSDRPTVVDVALYAYPSPAHEGGYDLVPYPAVRAWLDRIADRQGYVPEPTVYRFAANANGLDGGSERGPSRAFPAIVPLVFRAHVYQPRNKEVRL